MSLLKSKNPVFVVFEGLDGSGKSTIARLVAEKLNAKFITTPDEEIRKYRPAIIKSFSRNQEAAHLFYMSTVFNASRIADEYLAEGFSVVLDRYYLSTQAYASFRGSKLDLTDLEQMLRPADLTVYLDVLLNIRKERLSARGTSPEDRETLTAKSDRQLREEHFGRICLPVTGKTQLLECSDQTPEEIALEVVEKIKAIGYFR